MPGWMMTGPVMAFYTAAAANPVTAPAVAAAEVTSAVTEGSVWLRALGFIAGILLAMPIEYLLSLGFTYLFGVVSLSPAWFIAFAAIGAVGIVGYTVASGRWYTGALMFAIVTPKLHVILKLL